MIIFYNRINGEVIGTIDGRVHDEAQLKVNMGVSGVDPKDVEKIVCQWKISKYFDDKKNQITEKEALKMKKEKREVFIEFKPEHEQKDIFIELDKQPSRVYNYKVDIKTRQLVKK